MLWRRTRLECSRIFHVPLNRNGIDKTYHMVDEKFLRGLRNNPLIINTCRGEVFDTEAVRQARVSNTISGMVIDCWEKEPGIDLDLLKLTDYATPHIAGYSKDGKANGTKSSVRAISKYFGLGIDDWEPGGVDAPGNPIIALEGKHQSKQSILTDAILATYPIGSDDETLRNNTELFEQLRGDYPDRREFNSYSIQANDIEAEVLEDLESLGFNLLPGL
jgi:erythronate-4-phosphate dehydrogenase